MATGPSGRTRSPAESRWSASAPTSTSTPTDHGSHLNNLLALSRPVSSFNMGRHLAQATQPLESEVHKKNQVPCNAPTFEDDVVNESGLKQHPAILKLVAAHPRLFHRKPPRAWSDVPAGWISVVDQMCKDIDSTLDDAEAKQFRFDQIKEKLGGLRVYWKFRNRGYARPIDEPPLPGLHPGFERLFLIIHNAAEKAAQTCQKCGTPGTLTIVNGWHATFCEVHAKKPDSEIS